MKMGNLFYILAAILIIVWGIGLVFYDYGGFIHILPVIALIVIIFRLLQGDKKR